MLNISSPQQLEPTEADFSASPELCPSQFHEEKCSILTPDGASLSAVLTRPEMSACGAVVLLPGSGNVDHDGDVSGPFTGQGYRGQTPRLSQQLAHALAQRGILSLRYSKRGFDDPSRLAQQIIPYLKADALTALSDFRRRAPDLKTAIVGFSEGALLATLAAESNPVDALFLLAPMTRPIDQVLNYQFIDWPIALLSRHLDTDQDGWITLEDSTRIGVETLPLLGTALTTVFGNRPRLSLQRDLLPLYEHFFKTLASAPPTPIGEWIESLAALPDFRLLAQKIPCPVSVYQAQEDAQINARWVIEDVRQFPQLHSLRLYPQLGHAFAPMEGRIGDRKTSGPFDASLIVTLCSDVLRSLQ